MIIIYRPDKTMNPYEEQRTAILRKFGTPEAELEALLAYNENVFNHDASLELPLPDEPFVAAWERYIADAHEIGVFAALKKALVQLNFPIQAGISHTENYQAATKRGKSTNSMPEAMGLSLNHPEKLELFLHPTPGGRIPILIVRDRADFVAITQALSLKNEPTPVPDSKGAGVITGYNNWERIHQLKKQWAEANPTDNSEFAWQPQFKRIMPQKELYQDRFIILSDGNYSAVPADALGLAPDEWKNLSLVIRREHECAHYFTGRLFHSMRNNLVDELIADYAGIVGAIGSYRADWFLHFMGLENFPAYREGGRLQNYRGNLSNDAFEIVKMLVKKAAENLEKFDARLGNKNPYDVVMALTYLTLEALAAEDAVEQLSEIYREMKRKKNG